MSYLIGWGLLALTVLAIAFALRKLGPPGERDPHRPPSGRACCNTPPEVPGAPPERRPRRH